MSKMFLSLTLTLTACGLFFQWGMGNLPGLIGGILEIFVFSFLLTIGIYLFRRKIHFSILLIRTFLIIGSVTGAFSGVIFLILFLANMFPTPLSKITLSNGEKEIIYYQMSHIGTDAYYNRIQNEIRQYADSGYTIFVEGVRPGSPENHKRFEQALGMRLQNDTYEQLAHFIHMRAQDTSLFANISTGSLIRADLGVDDLVTLLSTGSTKTLEPVDISLELSSLTEESHRGQLMPYFFRGLLNLSLRYTSKTDTLMTNLGSAMYDAILTSRNQKIVDTYREKNASHAIMLYGALHFEGIYSLLKAYDPKWNIKNFEAMYPYQESKLSSFGGM